MSALTIACVLGCVCGLTPSASAFAGPPDDPFADVMVEYDPGENPSPGYTDPSTVLGTPTRFTAAGTEFPSVVSPFSSPYWHDEIVSIGAGGYLIVQFNTPVMNDPNNLYGIDLIVFGNTSFFDIDYPNGFVNGYFGDDGGIIEVSDDGKTWHTILGIAADGPTPAMGYLDAGPYDTTPGNVLTDFTRPIDPALNLSHFLGLTHEEVVPLYRGSGGGTGIDIGAVGLSQITHVRISNPVGSLNHIEIDAFSDVAPRRAGDVDLDGAVGVPDLLALINAWGTMIPGGTPADFNADQIVGVPDLLTVINNWGL